MASQRALQIVRVAETLRLCQPFLALDDAELQLLAREAKIQSFETQQRIITRRATYRRFFVLEEGRVRLRIYARMGKPCRGRRTAVLDQRGQLFGWSFMVRPGRIAISAQCLAPSRLIAVDLTRLGKRALTYKVMQGLLQGLYGVLQETGICPPNPRALLRFGVEHWE